MKRKYSYFALGIALFFTTAAKAQTYTPKVSKDSVGILTARVEALKASIKVQELKIKESEEETEVEKLRVKLLEANDAAKKSATVNSDNTKGTTVDIKATSKLAKQAKSDMEDAQKALERYNKQIKRVDDLRNEIQKEEQKLTYKKPIVNYNYK